MNNVAVRLIQNLKVMLEKKQFTEDEARLILLTVQEVAHLSTFETLSFLDNMQLAVIEAGKEMSQEEMDTLAKEIVEE